MWLNTFITISVLLLLSHHAGAIDYVATLSGDLNNWGDRSIWDPPGVPGSKDTVLIKIDGTTASTMLTMGSKTVKSMTVDGTRPGLPSRTRDVDKDPQSNDCTLYINLNGDLTVTGALAVTGGAVLGMDSFTVTAGSFNLDQKAVLEGPGTLNSVSTIAGIIVPYGKITFSKDVVVQSTADIIIMQRSSTAVDTVVFNGNFNAPVLLLDYYRPSDFTTSSDFTVLTFKKTPTIGNYTLRTKNTAFPGPPTCTIVKDGGNRIPAPGCAKTGSSGYSILLSSCATVPCQCAHGSCVSNSASTCSCPSTWTGNLCTEPKCPSDCNGRGPCTVPTVSGDPYCACSEGWSGNACQTGTCKNGCSKHGSCDLRSTSPQCVCSSGWAGDDCSIAYKSCSNNCGAHGTCNTNTGTCACDAGWQGNACAVSS